MNGLDQIHSANEAAARREREAYKKRLLDQGKTTICKLDVLGNIDINVLPLSFDSYDAAKGHLNKVIPLHLQKYYIITSPQA
jgi:hypothetical protein